MKVKNMTIKIYENDNSKILECKQIKIIVLSREETTLKKVLMT